MHLRCENSKCRSDFWTDSNSDSSEGSSQLNRWGIQTVAILVGFFSISSSDRTVLCITEYGWNKMHFLAVELWYDPQKNFIFSWNHRTRQILVSKSLSSIILYLVLWKFSVADYEHCFSEPHLFFFFSQRFSVCTISWLSKQFSHIFG